MSNKVAIILSLSDDPLIQCNAFGFYRLDQVLHIPSNQLIWIDSKKEDAFMDELKRRYPSDNPLFVRFARAVGHSPPEGLPRQGIQANIFVSEAYKGSSEDLSDELFERAKKHPIILLSNLFFGRRMRRGFIVDRGDGIRVLRFDQKRWAKSEVQRKKQIVRTFIVPPGYITVPELKNTADAMRNTLAARLVKNHIDTSWFQVEFKFNYRSKRHACDAVINLFNVGTELFGAQFWTKKISVAYGHWDVDRRKYVRENPARPIARRWKKEKKEPPEGKKAELIWKIIRSIAQAKLARR